MLLELCVAMTKEEKKQLIIDFIQGPLKDYLTTNISFGRFKEKINEQFDVDLIYSDLYPSYLFNGKITYE